MTLLAFVLALGLLVTVHEWGHFRMARACGVQVERFSIGFGPALLKWQRPAPDGSRTEFVLAAIPLGGYVKLLDSREEGVDPSRMRYVLDQQSLARRSAVVLAGPLANLGLAWVLYVIVLAVGQPIWEPRLAEPPEGSVAAEADVHSGEWVVAAGTREEHPRAIPSWQALRWWVMRQTPGEPFYLWVRTTPESEPRRVRLEPQPESTSFPPQMAELGLVGPWSPAVIASVLPQGPAARAGLRAGDEVRWIEDSPIPDAARLREWIRASGKNAEPQAQSWRIYRPGSGTLTLVVQPERVREGERAYGRVGAQLGAAPQTSWLSYDLLDASWEALRRCVEVTGLSLRMIAAMFTGEASLEHLSGPLTVADQAGRSMSVGWSAYFDFLALLSLSIAIFNLLPLPVLDGGHLLYYLYEFIVGRPPGEAGMRRMQQFGMISLLALMGLALFNDFNRLWGG